MIMITNEAFMQICMGVIMIMAGLITAFVVPWLHANMTQAELDQLNYYIAMAVRCAEQIYTPEEWRQKKEYVSEYILHLVNSKLCVGLTEDQLDTLIEGAVNEIKRGDLSAH